MEIFQTIWTALTTPNEGLISLFYIPLTIIEIIVSMLLYTTLLNIQTSFKQKVLYVICFSSLTIFLNTFFPKGILTPINMLLMPILVKLIFKTSILKSILTLVVQSIVIILLETIIVKLCILLFSITMDELISIPIYRLTSLFLIYLTIFTIYKISLHFNFNVTIIDDMKQIDKTMLICNSLLACIAIGTQFYLIGYYTETLPTFVTLLSFISLLTYFFISIYSLTRTTKLQLTEQSLEEAQLYNKSLKILHDNVRAFKHDFSNIVQAIGRVR